MTTKGAVRQLQADLTSDEEFDEFLQNHRGFLVLDVYTEWCGPCLGMVNILRKIQLDVGLHEIKYAKCKADSISYLHRFYRRSEPTWLFVKNRKAINLCFGANVSKLVKMINKELSSKKEDRTYYEIAELQPMEVAALKKKQHELAEAERKQKEEEEQKRNTYVTNITDLIMENMEDIGVTIFGPHVGREAFRNIIAPAEMRKIQCVDRHVVPVKKEDFDMINLFCHNPLEENVIKYLDGQQLFMCLWKIPNRTLVSEALTDFAKELTRLPVGEEGDSIYPILKTLELPLFNESTEPEEKVDITFGTTIFEPKKSHESIIFDTKKLHVSNIFDATYQHDMEELDMEEGLYLEEYEEEYEMVEYEHEIKEKPVHTKHKAGSEILRIKPNTMQIPAIWVPSDPRTHAALIYTYFRNHTKTFLPPDPVPEPTSIIMAFDTHKQKHILNIMKANESDILNFGFFTSDEPETAQLIAKTPEKYNTLPSHMDDKIVLRVKKATSNTMLTLAAYNPTYVSTSTEIGFEEAQIFFPEDQITAIDEIKELHQKSNETKPKVTEIIEPAKKKEVETKIRHRQNINKSDYAQSSKVKTIRPKSVSTEYADIGHESMDRKRLTAKSSISSTRSRMSSKNSSVYEMEENSNIEEQESNISQTSKKNSPTSSRIISEIAVEEDYTIDELEINEAEKSDTSLKSLKVKSPTPSRKTSVSSRKNSAGSLTTRSL